MIVLLNGKFLPEAEASISIHDRGFLYGDGLFETLIVRHGQPFRWQAHMDRLRQGAKLLRLKLPFQSDGLLNSVQELLGLNAVTDATLRIHITRGVGPRGYSTAGTSSPTVLMTLHPTTAGHSGQSEPMALITASYRVPSGDPLASSKTADKLRNVLARQEAEERGAQEALLLNTDGKMTEAASANLFWIEDQAVCTPPLSAGALGGITRSVVFEICEELGMELRECDAPPKALLTADGVFLTVSTRGVIEVASLDGHALKRSAIPGRLQTAYWECVERETRVLSSPQR